VGWTGPRCSIARPLPNEATGGEDEQAAANIVRKQQDDDDQQEEEDEGGLLPDGDRLLMKNKKNI
jgi:hypothetical protein